MTETFILKSGALGTNVLTAVIKPDDGEIHKLMILLHGKMDPKISEELFYKLPEELSLEELCNKYNIMAAIPFMRNRYYISTEDYDCGKYVAHELPDSVKRRYGLPDSIEMILAGVSMGGYGAALIAAQTGAFMKIISISGAYIANDVEIGNPEVWGDLTPDRAELKDSFLYYFLPLSDLRESVERNASAAIRMFKERGENPRFAVTCGTKDWLYGRNLDFLKALDDLNIEYIFDRIDGGGHDPESFRTGLRKAVEHLNLKG